MNEHQMHYVDHIVSYRRAQFALKSQLPHRLQAELFASPCTRSITMELHYLIKKPCAYKYINNITIFITTVLILLLVSTISYKRSAETVVLSNRAADDFESHSENCDIFSGEWVPDPNAPYYTHTTCRWLRDNRNCMRNGRPDSGFLKWRWRPDGCELPLFDPFEFLDLVRNKTMAFVGDSLAGNHLESMMCLLSRVENPVDAYRPDGARWKYENFNFTLVILWAPFLIRFDKPDYNNMTFQLYLDEFDDSWTSQIDEFDYIILNVGSWYSRKAVYHENRRVTGCHDCHVPNITSMPQTYGIGLAIRTAFQAINSRRNFHGMTFLRTFSPSHFEGKWSEGGDCLMRRPYMRNETGLEGLFLDIYETQLKEFEDAEKRSGKKKFRLLDTTRAMLMRPDGHPSRYKHGPDKTDENKRNDCLHWCMPGPADSWSDFLLHMMKR